MNQLSSFREQKKYSDSELIVIFTTIGKLHNEGLDSIFSLLESNSGFLKSIPNNDEKRKLIYSLINQSIHNFMKSNLKAENTNIDVILKRLFSESKTEIFYGKDLVTQVKLTKKNTTLSSTYFSLLNKVDSLINVNAEEKAYNKLISENIESLEEDFEKMQFVSSVSIAIHSVNYWKINRKKWMYLLNPNFVEKVTLAADANQKTDPNKAGNEIGKSDVSGIIYGAGSGCFFGAIGGTATLPGIGTITGCLGAGAVGALTGGLGNSAKTAVDKFVDWLTK